MPFQFRGWVVNLHLLMNLVLIGKKKKKRKFGEFVGGKNSPLDVLYYILSKSNKKELVRIG